MQKGYLQPCLYSPKFLTEGLLFYADTNFTLFNQVNSLVIKMTMLCAEL
jgi:hypothetical protein